MSMSPVNRGAPWKAKAYPPTIRYSTLCSFNNASRSLKSGCTSMVLTAQNLDGSNPFGRRTRLPEGKVVTRRGISELPLFYRLMNHATMIPRQEPK